MRERIPGKIAETILYRNILFLANATPSILNLGMSQFKQQNRHNNENSTSTMLHSLHKNHSKSQFTSSKNHHFGLKFCQRLI